MDLDEDARAGGPGAQVVEAAYAGMGRDDAGDPGDESGSASRSISASQARKPMRRAPMTSAAQARSATTGSSQSTPKREAARASMAPSAGRGPRGSAAGPRPRSRAGPPRHPPLPEHERRGDRDRHRHHRDARPSAASAAAPRAGRRRSSRSGRRRPPPAAPGRARPGPRPRLWPNGWSCVGGFGGVEDPTSPAAEATRSSAESASEAPTDSAPVAASAQSLIATRNSAPPPRRCPPRGSGDAFRPSALHRQPAAPAAHE